MMCENNPGIQHYYITQENVYTQILWIFAGGLFGGDVESLLQFDKLSKETCLQVIKEKENLMWEVNIWYMVYLKNNNLFSVYDGTHDMTLICNY